MRKFLLLAFILASCAPVSNGFMTKHGIYVETNGHEVAEQDIELATIMTIVLLSEKYPETYDGRTLTKLLALTNYVTKVVSDSIDCEHMGKKTKCSGLHKSNTRQIFYKYKENVSDTSFVHELLHLFRHWIEGDPDANHQDTRLFEKACNNLRCESFTIENIVNSTLRAFEKKASRN